MTFHRTAAIALRQYYLLRSSFTRIIPLFIWVALDIVVWGFITKYLNNITAAGLNFVPIFLGAVLFWDFLVRVMQGVTMAFMEDSWSRNFLNFFASPLRLFEYLSGLVLSSTITSMVGLVAMLLLATLVFGLSFTSYGMMLAPFLLVLFLTGIALGILGSSIMLRYGPASEWLIWPIPAVIAPFAGVFYPISTLPVWMQWIAYLLPPSYVFEGMRSVVANGAAPLTPLLFSLGLSLFYIVLACWFFARIHRYAVKSGLIARYSAETVS